MVKVSDFKAALGRGEVTEINNDILLFKHRTPKETTRKYFYRNSLTCEETIQKLKELNPVSLTSAAIKIVKDFKMQHLRYDFARLDRATHKPTNVLLDHEYHIEVRKLADFDMGKFTSYYRAMLATMRVINEGNRIMADYEFPIALPSYVSPEAIWKFQVDGTEYVGLATWDCHCTDGLLWPSEIPNPLWNPLMTQNPAPLEASFGRLALS